MRALAAAALLALPVAAAAAGDEPPVVRLEVGAERGPLGFAPICDDLTVVTVTAEGRVRGLRPGETLCSFASAGGAGARQVYRMVVVAPRPPPGEGGGD